MRSDAILAAVALGALFLAPTCVQATVPIDRHLPELKFQGVALVDAIDLLRDVSGANIHVDWKALEAAGVARDTPVNLRLKDVTLKHVLELMLNDAGGSTALAYVVDEGVIEITTRAAADRNMITRVFPIEDLLTEVPDFTDAPNFDLNAVATGGSSGNNQSGAANNIFGSGAANGTGQKSMSRAERAEQIVALVRETVAPDVWKENGGAASIRYFDGKLVVTAPVGH